MYLLQRARDEAKMRMTAEEWLRSLNTELLVEEMNERNRPRIVQLLNKANQMNLCTRRMDERELLGWSRDPKHKLWGFRVRDRFGDAGITGILSIACDSERAYVTDFVLSCRVMGRNVEQAMLAFAVQHCRELRIPELLARYTPTPKNKPCFEFWQKSGFLYDGTNNIFTWRLDQPYPFPAFLKISAQPTGASKGSVTERDSTAEETLFSYPAQ
jgi:FkbH-like protein